MADTYMWVLDTPEEVAVCSNTNPINVIAHMHGISMDVYDGLFTLAMAAAWTSGTPLVFAGHTLRRVNVNAALRELAERERPGEAACPA